MYCLDRVPGRGKFQDRARGIEWLPEKRKIEVSRDVKFLQKSKKSPAIVFEDIVLEDALVQRKEDSDLLDTEDEETDIEIKPVGNLLDVISNYDEIDRDINTQITPKKGSGRSSKLRTGMKGRPRKLFAEPRREMETFDIESAHLGEG